MRRFFPYCGMVAGPPVFGLFEHPCTNGIRPNSGRLPDPQAWTNCKSKFIFTISTKLPKTSLVTYRFPFDTGT